MNRRAMPILAAFLCMGFVDGVGAFVGLAQKQFTLSNFAATMIPFVGFIAFGFLSVPVGLLQDRTSKKTILLAGLVFILIGTALSWAGLHSYGLFLATILLMGIGTSVLQVAGNPIMRDVSDPKFYSRNLSIGQCVKAVGSISGSLVPALLTCFSVALATIGIVKDWQVLFPMYTVLLAITVLWVAMTRIEEHRDAGGERASLGSCLALLGNPYVLTMVLAIFLYVGTEVCISANVPLYLKDRFSLDLKTWGILGNSLFFVCLLAGRFMGSVVLNWIAAAKFFLLTVLVTVVGLAGLLFANSPQVGVVCIILAGIGCANIFPLVFSIAVNHMPERTNEISGLMVTAIVGGAVMPPVMGKVADLTGSTTLGFLVPLVCVLYLLFSAAVAIKTASDAKAKANA
ncbi:MAG: MFS transporter [Planctomycetaceae bacterium]|nr:MFS transporter [Planctomycetaceae bacterium]